MFRIYRIIYLPENRTIYIGRTGQELNLRFNQHWGHKKEADYKFLHTHGTREDYVIEEIDRAETKADANRKEIFWTEFYRNKLGYALLNINDGTSNSQSTIDKIIVTKNKRRDNYCGVHNANYGKKYTNAEKEKLRASQPMKKRVRCIETNIVYSSLGEAMQKTKIPRSNISYCCRNIRQTAGGYHWEFSN